MLPKDILNIISTFLPANVFIHFLTTCKSLYIKCDLHYVVYKRNMPHAKSIIVRDYVKQLFKVNCKIIYVSFFVNTGLKFPSNTEFIKLHGYYNCSLPNLENLQELELGIAYNQILPCFPNLKKLSLGHNYNQILPCFPNLEVLRLNIDYMPRLPTFPKLTTLHINQYIKYNRFRLENLNIDPKVNIVYY